LWEVLKQSGVFAIGETSTALAEFQIILNAESASYNHMETPQELLELPASTSDKK
jgi:hypothetical protein